MELPTLPKWLQNARLHVCYADDVHLRLREVRAFMLAVKAREPQAPQWRRWKDMCVRVCVCLELKGQGEKENRCYRFALTSKYAWLPLVEPFNSKCVPPIPHHSPHTLPAPTTFILAHVTSVLGTAEQVFSLPWQPVEGSRPLAASGEEEKRPTVSEVVCLGPACHCFQSAAGGATLAERAAAGRGPQGPPATAVGTAGRDGGPRGQCH